jgi:hypothetical protein
MQAWANEAKATNLRDDMTHSTRRPPGRAARDRTLTWYVTAAVLVAVSAWPARPDASLASPTAEQRAEAKELRQRAQSLSERGELGEAIFLAVRADQLDPDEAR